MNNHNNRLIRAIVAIGSLIAIIAIGLPWVDEYVRLRRDAAELGEMRGDLLLAEQRDAQLKHLEETLSAELASYAARSVEPSRTSELRDTLIEIVRTAGARLRNIDVGRGETRAWAIENDDPRHATISADADESDFELYTQPVELRADGSLAAVRKVLADVRRQGWLMTTTGIKLVPTGAKESPVSLELRLVVYGLGPRGTHDDDNEFASRAISSPLR